MIADYSESDTRSKLIDPALYQRGWREDQIKREENAGGITIVRGKPRRDRKHVDYVLRVRVAHGNEPVALALIEAKKSNLPPGHGIEQAKQYAESKRLNVPFVFTSNGYQFVEYDAATGITHPARLMEQFPTPDQLRQRYEQYKGYSLEDSVAKPLLTAYSGGDAARRYYQDAAIRAVFEHVAAGNKRALLSLATGAGKTRIAVLLLKRIADAGQLQRALFVCDRTELRDQAVTAFQNIFGNDAQPVDGRNPRKNARILIATYQTLDVDSDDGSASFFLQHYPENYFSHMIIDEAHRSAWGKWSIVLTHNSAAVQIGLTATPRQLKIREDALASPEVIADLTITADNLKYFGEPVYEYDMGQGIQDGYLAACEIVKGRVNLDDTGITKAEILHLGARHPITGQLMTADDVDELYHNVSFEDRILLPDRQLAMAQDLFDHLLQGGSPEQKTIIFCVNDTHADLIASALNNLYVRWCSQRGRKRCDHYAFKCTAASSGNDMLPDFRSSSTDWFIATTVDLLSTGVDVPRLRNIVFFRYVKSPISFYQMVGRGTRIFAEEDKLSFRIFDYTDATDLFGEEFITSAPSHEAAPEIEPEPQSTGIGEEKGEYVSVKAVEVVGFDVFVTGRGHYVMTKVDGRDQMLTLQEYEKTVAAQLLAVAPDLPSFRQQWVEAEKRDALLRQLPAEGQSALLIRELKKMKEYDLYDVLAALGYGIAPRTMEERADAFAFKQATWLNTMPAPASATLRAIAVQFARGGSEELESGQLWNIPEVSLAGGLRALRELGKPVDVLRDAKVRIFAA